MSDWEDKVLVIFALILVVILLIAAVMTSLATFHEIRWI